MAPELQQYVQNIECDSCMSIENAKKTITDAVDLLSSLRDCDQKIYNEIAKALEEYERDLNSGSNVVDAQDIESRGCKIIDSLCVRNSIRVGGDVVVRGEVTADSVTTNNLTANIANIITLNSQTINSQIINATSINSDIANINVIRLCERNFI